ncbi:MAG: PepSY domain-containing protein [Rhodoferax sp.]|nr:PepSY domain-containing protein [Rhodoferax sp.]
MQHQNASKSNQAKASARPWRAQLLVLCAVALMGVSGMGRAESDHDRARQALEAGAVLPLGTILERIGRDNPGQVLDVELDLEKHGGLERWIYEIKLLRTGGALVKLEVDARTGSVISRKVKD